MNLNHYFERINYDGPRDVSLEALIRLQRAHLFSVPFENLDIHHKRPIVLGVAHHYEKIVMQHRGGFCYEQNGLFSAILREIGFDVALMRAEVPGGDSHEFDHLTLMVKLDERWLVDVGFGSAFLDPLRLDDPGEQVQGTHTFRVEHDGERGVYAWLKDGNWQDQFYFFLEPRQLEDFAGGCHFHQSSPQSSFTQKVVCSLATPTGRKTISNMQYIVTEDGQRSERPIANEDERTALLRDEFGVVLD